MKAVRQVCLAVAVFVCVSGWAQTGRRRCEQGIFNLHKFEQLIGKETYTLTRTPDEVILKSDFKFTDRGTRGSADSLTHHGERSHAARISDQGQDFALFFH